MSGEGVLGATPPLLELPEEAAGDFNEVPVMTDEPAVPPGALEAGDVLSVEPLAVAEVPVVVVGPVLLLMLWGEAGVSAGTVPVESSYTSLSVAASKCARAISAPLIIALLIPSVSNTRTAR